MRAWVGTPQVEEAVGGAMMVGIRDDGYSVMMPAMGMTPMQLRRLIDTYLDEDCTCDTSMGGHGHCMVHREVMVA